MGSFQTRVYETDNFDVLSHSVHNRVYNSEVDLRTITQREDLLDWTGSHNLNSFLPTSKHIVGSSDTLQFPKELPKELPKEVIPVIVVPDYWAGNICKNEPESVFCKRKTKLIKNY